MQTVSAPTAAQRKGTDQPCSAVPVQSMPLTSNAAAVHGSGRALQRHAKAWRSYDLLCRGIAHHRNGIARHVQRYALPRKAKAVHSIPSRRQTKAFRCASPQMLGKAEALRSMA